MPFTIIYKDLCLNVIKLLIDDSIFDILRIQFYYVHWGTKMVIIIVISREKINLLLLVYSLYKIRSAALRQRLDGNNNNYYQIDESPICAHHSASCHLNNYQYLISDNDN